MGQKMSELLFVPIFLGSCALLGDLGGIQYGRKCFFSDYHHHSEVMSQGHLVQGDVRGGIAVGA